LEQTFSKNKKKIFNDPLYGFVTLPYDIVFDIIEHPWFQRLRRIKQLGSTSFVYPGALHTRFHHALGAMHLMTEALDVLRSKKTEISEEEAKGAVLAILLHDIGHGPLSHALEHVILPQAHHEDISLLLMEKLNEKFNGELTTAIQIFKGTYHRKFFHQLVSGQLDMDRLDYLLRDSFYTGVSEGIIGTQRLIKMLNVSDDELVIEEKAIYSVEKFLVARRLMYWQVYLHKTVVMAEMLIVNILQRAKELYAKGETVFCTPALLPFMQQSRTVDELNNNAELLENFTLLDDSDITICCKIWSKHNDTVLANLCNRFVNRRLFHLNIQQDEFTDEVKENINTKIQQFYKLSKEEAAYFVITGQLENNAYNQHSEQIKLLKKDGSLVDVASQSDNLNLSALANPVTKHYLAYPKEILNI
jgi:HD superfamily phosphohydrolase